MKVEQLNQLPREPFVRALGWIFEQSPWVAERAWEHRPFASLEELHQAMVTEVEEATVDEQLELLRAHPDLGSKIAMSRASLGEQAQAGLNQMTPEEADTLFGLNAAYRLKFGFPFIYAVKGCTPQDILVALGVRYESGLEDEFPEALRQVYRIAWFRLEGME